ncbi:MAG: thiamine phosphate synthase [Pseudomonadota bacterium]
MADFASRVIALNRAAWSLRRAGPRPCTLPFALALFSDAQRLPPLEELVEQLPRDTDPVAIVFRHDHLPEDQRLAVAGRVCEAVQARGHLFIMARASLSGADGHHAVPVGSGIRTTPVHNEEEIAAATLAGADAMFLSPVNGTASHPAQPPLGRSRAVALAQAARLPVFALGGMHEATAAVLEGTPFQGFGAIDAFRV